VSRTYWIVLQMGAIALGIWLGVLVFDSVTG
jgi:hypothetical protein